MTWKWINLVKRKQPKTVRLLCPVQSVLIPLRENQFKVGGGSSRIKYSGIFSKLMSKEFDELHLYLKMVFSGYGGFAFLFKSHSKATSK